MGHWLLHTWPRNGPGGPGCGGRGQGPGDMAYVFYRKKDSLIQGYGGL